jgi:uncharacterized protein
MARVTVIARPRARQTRVVGRRGSAWKLDLASPPVDGKANEECIRFLAELAGVPRARVRIVTGLASRIKVIELEGMQQEDLDSRFSQEVNHGPTAARQSE